MVLTIIQLTDIHFSLKNDNPLLDRKESLFRAIAAEARGSSALLVLITGDIANIGVNIEYSDYAFGFFALLKEELSKELNIKVDFVFQPGNHDCDFSNQEEYQLRETIIRGLQANQFSNLNDATIKMVTKQDPFNEFKSIFHEDWNFCKALLEHPLLTIVKISNDLGKEIHLNLYNSSWLSRIKEKPGELFMPLDILSDKVKLNKNVITISSVHHPDHWFYPNNRREWVNFIEKTSNFVLTGHEHVDSAVEKTNWNNKKTHFIEGRSLQDLYEKDNSGFNSIKLNLSNSSFSLSRYILTSQGRYEINHPIMEKEIDIISPFGKDIEFNPSFLQVVNDIGLPLTHPRKEDLLLSDLYVLPDVEEVLYADDQHSTFLKEPILKILKEDTESILLFTGDHESGKTSLSRYITMNFLQKGIFPLLVKGNEIKGDLINSIEKLIDRISPVIYNKDSIETYKQLKREERILIIDDWHQCLVNSKLKQNFIKNAKEYFKQIIVLSEINSNISDAIELVPVNDEYNLRHLQLIEFGHVKQDELVTKWVSLGQEEVMTEDKLVREKDSMLQALRPIISNGVVPKYPIYLLIMLKAIENGQPHDLSKSSNGYYFEVLIKDALSTIEIKNKDLDKLYTYLTGLSECMSHNENREITEYQWRHFHQEHLKYHDLEDDQLNLKEYRDKLLNNKIIKQYGDSYSFYHPYLYYYFVAQYYATRMGTNDIQRKVKYMCQNLQNEEYANIIMFLTHLSKEEIIINEVLSSARSIFENISPLQLDNDIIIINELIDEVYQIYVDREIDVVEYRRQENELLDQNERESKRKENLSSKETAATIKEDDEHDDTKYVLERIDSITKGFKIIEITGQILKNYYGSLSSIQKSQLCEELFKLGFRIVHSFILDLKEHHQQIISLITSQLLERGQEADSKKAEKFAKQLLFRLSSFIIFKTLIKIGLSVGTNDLDPTYRRVIEQLNYHTAKLAYIGIKLDYYENFPITEVATLFQEIRENPMAKTLLREQVRRYLYMFPTTYSEKQKICASVHITLGPAEQLKLNKLS